ncbi:hypothetical protein V8B55DRAFT_1566879 [Mucor lusitanicus]
MFNPKKEWKPSFNIGDIVKLYRDNISTSWSAKMSIRWHEDNFCVQEKHKKGSYIIKNISNPDDPKLHLVHDLLSDDEIVQDKLHPADILITKTIKPARPTPEVNKTNGSIKIRGIAKRDKNNSLGLQKDIQKKISKLCQDLVTIKHLQNRRKRYLEEILPCIKEKLFGIYRLDSEELTLSGI